MSYGNVQFKIGNCVRIVTGTEGPRHDPYGYTEVTIFRYDEELCRIHVGLLMQIRVAKNENNEPVNFLFYNFEKLEEYVQNITGYTLSQWTHFKQEADMKWRRNNPEAAALQDLEERYNSYFL